MSPGVGAAMSAAPLLLRAKRFRIAANPCFSFHEAAAFGAALAVFDKEGTRLTGLVALLTDLCGDLAVTKRLASGLQQALSHPVCASFYLGCAILEASSCHQLPLTLQWPR